jgi:hypothetical protein
MTDLATFRPSPSLMLAKWSQLVGQTICRPDFVQKDPRTRRMCHAGGVALTIGMADRSQIQAVGNFSFGVAPPTAIGRSDVCLARDGPEA